ncbi:MAG: ABC transporter ATP-binding protein, partial [Crenarchaeota archaeon]|nr:ABC transporter ATP-binding protein [Thermoproteota archaeon]
MGEEEPPDELPSEVTALLESMLGKDEKIVRFLLSDIDEEGNFGECWLILTTERMITVNAKTNHIFEVPLKLVRSAEARDYVGNSELIVETTLGPKNVIRFSRRFLENFRKTANLVDTVAKNKEMVNGMEADEHYWIRHPKFAKRKVVRWLFSYLKPNLHYLVVSLVFSSVIVGLNLIPPRLMGTLVDQVFP